MITPACGTAAAPHSTCPSPAATPGEEIDILWATPQVARADSRSTFFRAACWWRAPIAWGSGFSALGTLFALSSSPSMRIKNMAPDVLHFPTWLGRFPWRFLRRRWLIARARSLELQSIGPACIPIGLDKR